MNADMRQVNAAWQDGKYEEFVQGYQPQIRKCEEIANRYNDWCMKVLDPTIENVTAVENTDVSGSSVGGSVGGGSSIDTGFSSSSSSSVNDDRFSKYNY